MESISGKDWNLQVALNEANDILAVATCHIVIPDDPHSLLRLQQNPQLSKIAKARLLKQPQIQHMEKVRLLQEAKSRYSNILKNIAKLLGEGKSKELTPLKFPMLCYSRSCLTTSIWGHDSLLEGCAVDTSAYCMNKYTHITNFLLSDMCDRTYLRNSVKEKFNKHGYDGALAFLLRLWDDFWIFDPRVCSDVMWKYKRAKAFSLEEPMSEEHYIHKQGRRMRKRARQDTCFRRAAYLDRKSNRNPELLIEEAARMQKNAEERLHRARSETQDINNWIRSIFSILPTYLVVLYLYKEVYFSTENSEIRKNLSQEMRFVDERQADILSTVASTPGAIINSYSKALIAYKKGDKERARKILEFYCEGRVFYPKCIYEQLENQLGLPIHEIMNFFFNKLRRGFRRAFEIKESLAGIPHISDIMKLFP